ncbi:hypothetical protein [Mesobacillus zeae]|uniref:Uncharacterized protein n=1 Tax=Mesobacillus zeae TaxID=1917180 RepID=A0A398BK60_9BACI|nr:hypothetical protein [Mesobacillus zeae]RID88878.1 hypothetical protein D1970_01155 [Mesobacillus zeae]
MERYRGCPCVGKIILSVVDTVSGGIPFLAVYLLKQPRKTLEISLIVIPVIAAATWFLLSY